MYPNDMFTYQNHNKINMAHTSCQSVPVFSVVKSVDYLILYTRILNSVHFLK